MKVVTCWKIVVSTALTLSGLVPGATAQEVVIPDPGLSAAFRRALGKLSGPLTLPELLSLTNLNADAAFVQSLEGLEAARQLVRLDLQNNFITNAVFPSELTALRWLDLHASRLTEFAVPGALTNLSLLHLGGNSLTSFALPSGLSSLTNLDVSFNPLTDLLLPEGLINLQTLNLFTGRLTDLTIPSDYTQLTELFAAANQLTNVSLPAGLTQLARLDLRDNQLTSLTVPEGLTNLMELALGNNRLGTLTLPPGLNNLESLSVRDNQLTEFNAPAGLTSLTELDLAGNPLERFTLPADADQLRTLSLSADQLREVSVPGGLAKADVSLEFDESAELTLPVGLASLRRVRITGGHLSDLTGLTNLPELNQLSLELPGNTTGELAWPTGLTNLTALHLGQNQVTNFAFLSAMPTLRTLSWDVNHLTNLELPFLLLDLTTLHLEGSRLADYSFLRRLPSLTTLTVDLDEVSHLTLPTGLRSLQSLRVGGGELSSISLPGDLTNLTALSLAGNQLTTVALPEGLTRLRELDLSRNQLSSLTLPDGLTNLASLDLSLNRLTNLLAASALPSLAVLDLRNNSLASLTLPADAPQLHQVLLDSVQTLALPAELANAGLADEVAALQRQGGIVITYPGTAFPLDAEPVDCPVPGFRAPRSAAVGPYPRSLAVADFNNDSIADLAVANAGCASCLSEGFVSIWLARADGSYHAAVPLLATAETDRPSPGQYQPGAGPVSVAASDFDADGKIDLAVANQGSHILEGTGSVSILRGRGDGTFEPGGEYLVGSRSIAVSIGDFNGDNIADLAVANGGPSAQDSTDDNVTVLLGQGDGSFAFVWEAGLPIGSGPTSPSAGRTLAAGDLNEDGTLDLVVLRHEFNAVSVLLNFGDGTLASPLDVTVEGRHLPASLALSDLNGDGHLDLVVANSDTSGVVGDPNTVSVLLGNGNGTFQTAVEYPTAPWSGMVGSVDIGVADFNRDGQPDLAVANGDAASVSILLARGDGNFGPSVNYEAGPGVYALAVRDVDHDGQPDLLGATSSRLLVLSGNVDGTFQAAVKFAPGRGPVSVQAADLNRDGRLDLVLAHSWPSGGLSNSAPVSVLFGRGNGSFFPAMHYATGLGPGAVAIGDLNGDGRLDVVVANRGADARAGQTNSGSISTLLAATNLTFRAAGSYTNVQSPVSAKLSDFNADGKLDLVVANSGVRHESSGGLTNSAVAMFLGNGDGTLQPPVLSPVQLGPEIPAPGADLVAVADLNRDGNPDLVVARHGSPPLGSGVSVLVNRGDGTFDRPVDFDLGGSANMTSVSSGDFNGDGVADIAAVGGGGVSLLLGRSDGTLGSPSHSEVGINFGAAAPVDFDADLKTDLAVLGGETGLVILFGDGGGAFDRTRNYGVASGPCCIHIPSLAPGDFDGNGRLDLAVADGVSVAVHLNICNELLLQSEKAAVAGAVRISWPFTSDQFQLEATRTLGVGQWQPVSAPAATNDNRLEITVPADQPQRFFRLHRP